jgi:ABC-2 type transport system ATP-binding protein
VICEGTPQELQASVDGDRLTLRLSQASEQRPRLEEFLSAEARPVGDRLCFRLSNAADALQRTMAEFGSEILSAEVARPTLEDVFLEKTGRVLSNDDEARS